MAPSSASLAGQPPGGGLYRRAERGGMAPAAAAVDRLDVNMKILIPTEARPIRPIRFLFLGAPV